MLLTGLINLISLTLAVKKIPTKHSFSKRKARSNLWARIGRRNYAHWKPHRSEAAREMRLPARLKFAQEQLAHASSAAYLDELVGTVGADPIKPIEFVPSEQAGSEVAAK